MNHDEQVETEQVLTRAMLEQCRTDKGGFTNATLQALGIDWPPVHGWPRRIVGRSITRDAYQKALDGRLTFVRKKRNRVRDVQELF